MCERNIDRLPLKCALTRDRTHNPGVCPEWDQPAAFCFVDDTQPTEPHGSGLADFLFVFLIKSISLVCLVVSLFCRLFTGCLSQRGLEGGIFPSIFIRLLDFDLRDGGGSVPGMSGQEERGSAWHWLVPVASRGRERRSALAPTAARTPAPDRG